jgi:hypothetical protein
MDPKASQPFWRPDPYFRRAALIALLCVLPSLWAGLQLDDYFHWALVNRVAGVPALDMPASPFNLFGFLDGNPVRARQLMEQGLIPWWSLETIRFAFWRPLVEWTHAFDYRILEGMPWLMHAHSLVYFVIMLWLAHRLFDRLLHADASRWATLLFALHYSHGLPAGWLANRNALLVTIFVLLTLLLHLRARGRFSPWALGAFLCALLSGEMGVSAGLMLFAYTACLDDNDLRRRCLTLLPYGVVGGVWLVLRHQFGYGAGGSGHYLDPFHDPAGFVAVALPRFLELFTGTWLPLPPEFATLIPGTVRLGVGVGVVLTVLALTARLLHRDPVARFFGLSMTVCLLPVMATIPHSRLLMCVSVGACGLAGLWLAENRSILLAGRGGAWRKPLSIGVVILGCVISPLLLALESVSIAIAMQGIVNRGALSLPWTPEDARTRLVLVNPPLSSAAGYLAGIRLHAGLAVPATSLSLASGRADAVIGVVDAHTLRYTMEAGLYEPRQENLLRGPDAPLKPGDRVELEGVRIEVERVDPAGIPVQVLFRFALPLDDPAQRFVLWNSGNMTTCHWPAPGSNVRVDLATASCDAAIVDQ